MSNLSQEGKPQEKFKESSQILFLGGREKANIFQTEFGFLKVVAEMLKYFREFPVISWSWKRKLDFFCCQEKRLSNGVLPAKALRLHFQIKDEKTIPYKEDS